MKIVCVGADPAALYLGILLKRKDSGHTVRFVETGGDTTSLPSSMVCNPLKRRLKLADVAVAAAANAEVATFDRVEVDTGEHRFETQGLVYASVHTAALIAALGHIATDAGCEFHTCAPDAVAAAVGGADLIVLADHAAHGQVPDAPPCEATAGANLFIAFESTTPRNAMSHSFRKTPGGMMHVVAWPQAGGATVVVEATEEAIRANRLANAKPTPSSRSAASISPMRSTAYRRGRKPARMRAAAGVRSLPFARAAGTAARRSSWVRPHTPRTSRSA